MNIKERVWNIMARIPQANEAELDAIGIELQQIEKELIKNIKKGVA